MEDQTNGQVFELQRVPEFVRTLGVPRFRWGKPCTPGPVSLNNACLLEAANIPDNVLLCSPFGPVQIDCNRFHPSTELLDEDPNIATQDPKLGDMDKLCAWINDSLPLEVYKYCQDMLLKERKMDEFSS
jgi:hypothetical protein